MPATFTVTTLDDEFVPGGNADVSLREALFYVNTGNDSPGTTDIIEFDAALDNGTIVLGNIGFYGNLYAGENVYIDASNLSSITVDFINFYNFRILGPDVDYVRINNVDLFDGYSPGSGGAIANFVGADLYLSNLEISDSYAFLRGGAIFQYGGGNLTIDTCVFSDNDAYYSGGAIRFNTGPATDFDNDIRITNSTFDNNNAGFGAGTGNGGAISLKVGDDFLDTSSFYVRYSYFFDNDADGGVGGAIAVDVDGNFAGEFDLRDSFFGNPLIPGSGNYAENAGGAIHIAIGGNLTNSGNIIIDPSYFYFNVVGVGGVVGGDGGAINIDLAGDLYGTIDILDSFFGQNTANLGDGGAVNIEMVNLFGDVTVDFTFFYGNVAQDDGGGVNIDLFGGLYGTIIVSDSDFYNNEAQGILGFGHGGGLNIDMALDLEGSIAISHSGLAYGGFYSNYADDYGGGVSIDVGGDLYGSITINSVLFNDNRADSFDGGAVHININGNLYGGDITFTNSYFYDNSAFDDGGAVNVHVGNDFGGFFGPDATLTFNNCTFGYYSFIFGDFGNSAGGNGGAVAVRIDGDLYAGASITITNTTTFIENDGDNGGGLYLSIGQALYSSITINNSSFYRNTAASGDGGGASIYVGGDVLRSGEVNVTFCDFFNNAAGDDGGGLAFYGGGDFGNIITPDVNFNISLSYFGTTLFVNGGNTAGGSGGGVSIHVGEDFYGNLNVTDTLFYDNFAGDVGGGLDMQIGAVSDATGDFTYYADVEFLNVSFLGNNAAISGGGLSFITYAAAFAGTYFGGELDGDITMASGTTFQNNIALGGGGGAYIRADGNIGNDSEITLNNTYFNANFALGTDGGGLAIHAFSTYDAPLGEIFGDVRGNITITDAYFINNHANESGGGAYIFVGDDFYSLIDIESTRFEGNYAGDPGGGLAMVVNDEMVGNVNLYQSGFYDNYSAENGGGADFGFIDEFHGNVNILLSTFYGNVAGGYGGGLSVGVYGILGEGNVNVVASTFDSNDADRGGGGIAFYDYGTDSTLLVSYSTISRNDADYSGGGIWASTYSGFVFIVNSTIYLNDADDYGGGVFLFDGRDFYLAIYNSTIAGNNADLAGGGIFAYDNVYMLSTIVANNTALLTGEGDDLGGGGDFYALYSLIGDSATGNGSTINDGGTGSNIYDVDPLLGPLADNGGPTLTLALLSGSPAIDTGFNPVPLSLDYDQRGPGFPRAVGDQTDIGAYEYQADDDVLPPTIILGGSTGIEDDGETQYFTWNVYDASGLSYVHVVITQDGATIYETFGDPLGNFNFDSFGLGVFEITVTATDADSDYPGDEATAMATRDVTVIDDDTLPPTITLGGSSGIEDDGDTQYFTWDVTDASEPVIVLVSITKDGVEIYSSTNASGSFNFDSYGLGDFEITVTATDHDHDWIGDQETSYDSRSVTVFDDDTTLPSINLGGSSGTEYLAEPQLFTWNVNDASGLSYVNVSVTRNGVEIYNSADASGNFDFDAFGPGFFQITVTATDADLDWVGDELTRISSRTCTVIVDPDNPLFAVGSGPGQNAFVNVYRADGTFLTQLNPFPGHFGGVTVAVGDVNGDFFNDIIVGAGPGGGPHVKVYDGETFAEIASFFAFAPFFTGGVYVAAGDTDGDGDDDVIVGAGASGGPHVRVFDGQSFDEIESFFAFVPTFTGGVRVGAGDVNNDGDDDVIVGAGPGGGPHVRAIDVSGLSEVELESFFAFDPGFMFGVFVAGGDITDDGIDDIIVGNGSNFPGLTFEFPGLGITFPALGFVRVFDPLAVSGGGAATPFLAIDPYPTFVGGVTVAATDVDGDGDAEIVTGAGPTGGPHVMVLGDTPDTFQAESFFAFDISFHGGVFVG